MANPTCTKAGLSASCLRVPNSINKKQQKALLLRAKTLELAAIGGTDYIGRDALLLSDAATLTCGMRKPDLDAAMLQIAYNSAASAGAVVPTTLQAKLAQVVCLLDATEDQLDEALVNVQCKLGRAKAYPQ